MMSDCRVITKSDLFPLQFALPKPSSTNYLGVCAIHWKHLLSADILLQPLRGAVMPEFCGYGPNVLRRPSQVF